MTMRLKINDKLDEKLQQEFSSDPYADITIQLQQGQIRLSIAYLSMESSTFASLPIGTQLYDLSAFDQNSTLAVLRSLYGGPLQCTSATDFELLWPVINHLDLQGYRKNVEIGVRSWLQRREGGAGVLQWVEVCLNQGILKEWIVDWLAEQQLRILESTKNYLQLGKMRDSTINYILLQFLQRHPNNTQVVNTVLENYFNRKGHSPNQYFKSPQLTPLRNIWEEHHHRFKALRLQKNNFVQNLMATTTSPRMKEEEPKSALKRRGAGNQLYSVSMNLGNQMSSNEKGSESNLLDMRICVLSNQLEQKSKQIDNLRYELQELQELKLKNGSEQGENEGSIFDIGLLKSRMRSRKQKYGQQETVNQYALDVPSKRVIETEREQKLKVVSKGLNQKKV